MNTRFKLSFFFVLFAFVAQAQEILPIAFDLNSPIDVNLDASGNAWVALSGSGMDDGQVVRINTDQTTDVIIADLPSYFDMMSGELQGALSARLMADGRILLVQGAGPDPASASIIEFHIDDWDQGGAPLTIADSHSMIKVGDWALAQGFAESNPYSFLIDGDGNYMIVDAAANAVFKYDVSDESFSVVAEFEGIPNPLPFGPPYIDPVPTKILAHPSDGWLVSTLTGFPFVDGLSRIFHVKTDGTTEIYVEGLTLITDMEFDPFDDQLLVQQFARFAEVDSSLNFVFGSAQMLKIDDQGNLDTLLSGYGPSPGMAVGPDGSVYMTHLFLGQLLKVEAFLTGVESPNIIAKSFDVFPNPNSGNFSASLQLESAGDLQGQVFDPAGRLIKYVDFGYYSSGNHEITLSLEIPKGVYFLRLQNDTEGFMTKFVKQ